MNRVILIGRLTRDPDITFANNNEKTCIARYTLAVDRRYVKEGGQETDFIPCVCFGKSAEWADRYLRKGIKMAVTGRIQTGSYTNKDGIKVYTTDIMVEDQEFAESKSASQERQEDTSSSEPTQGKANEGFMMVDNDVEDELPFN